MRRKGELTTTEAAERLEVHHTAMRRWAQGALAGFNAKLRSVRVDAVGRYWIAEDDLQRIVAESASAAGQPPPPKQRLPRATSPLLARIASPVPGSAIGHRGNAGWAA